MGPLEAWTDATYTSAAAIFPIAPARVMITNSPQAWFGTGTFFAPNPDFNAGINYFVRNGGGNAEIVISDKYGNVVRTLSAPAATGVNHASWDLRSNPPAPAAGGAAAPAAGGRGGGRGGAPQGQIVAPGKYVVTITIPGVQQPLTGEIVVSADPIR
jgi:hypothetical protein